MKLKAELVQNYGSGKAKQTLTHITKAIRRLEMFHEKEDFSRLSKVEKTITKL